MPIKVEESYALDDSCQVKFWMRGHIPWGAFIEALESHIEETERDIPRWVILQAPVLKVYQRTVPCRGSIVSETMLVYGDKAGRGAMPVTVMDFWFPLHAYKPRPSDRPLVGERHENHDGSV